MHLQTTGGSRTDHTTFGEVCHPGCPPVGELTANSEASLASIGDQVQVLTCRGDIDLVSAAGVRGAIQRATAHFLIVDLTDVPFMDAAGVGVLIAAYRRYPDGKLAVCCPPGEPRHVLKVTGMQALFRARDTVTQANEALNRTPLDGA